MFKEQQLNALKKMKFLMENISFYPKKSKLPFQFGILCGIESMQRLYTEMKSEGWQYILTARLNQDICENLFSQIRGLGGKMFFSTNRYHYHTALSMNLTFGVPHPFPTPSFKGGEANVEFKDFNNRTPKFSVIGVLLF